MTTTESMKVAYGSRFLLEEAIEDYAHARVMHEMTLSSGMSVARWRQSEAYVEKKRQELQEALDATIGEAR